MTKRALVVGINDYSPQFGNGSSNLHGCVADATSFRDLLVDAFLFPAEEIRLLTDGDATSDAIKSGLKDILVDRPAGDVACFYYSGHGSRESASDGVYYEAIVPAAGDWITDWDVFNIASALEPSFVNFTVVLDSCHSGGMSQETENARTFPLESSWVETMIETLQTLVPCGIALPDLSPIRNNVSNVHDANGLVDLDEDPDRVLIALAKSTLIAACRFDQYSFEHPSLGHGFLTQSFIDLVDQSNFLIDHESLLDELRTRVAGRVRDLVLPTDGAAAQTPQLRGQMNRMAESFLEPWVDSR